MLSNYFFVGCLQKLNFGGIVVFFKILSHRVLMFLIDVLSQKTSKSSAVFYISCLMLYNRIVFLFYLIFLNLCVVQNILQKSIYINFFGI